MVLDNIGVLAAHLRARGMVFLDRSSIILPSTGMLRICSESSSMSKTLLRTNACAFSHQVKPLQVVRDLAFWSIIVCSCTTE